MKSIVKWFNSEKGYGFIEYKGNNILVRYRAFQEQEHKTIDKDKIVEFELVKTDKGYEIKNITLT